MNHTNAHIGRAKTVLVFGSGDQAQAVMTEISAVTKAFDQDLRIHFAELATFDEPCSNYIQNTILPIIDQIQDQLDLPQKSYELYVSNVGAASLMNVGLTVTGFSADVPVFLAMLSALLEISIPQDVVSTGHIASINGDITFVKSIPAKIQAAVEDAVINRFVYPSIDHDTSVASFTPTEKQRVEDAVTHAKQFLQCLPVNYIEEVMKPLVTDEDIILSSLKHGYWQKKNNSPSNQAMHSQLIKHFLVDHEKRFWMVLNQLFFSKEIERVKQLLSARIAYEIQNENYPHGIGLKLYQSMLSLPPSFFQKQHATPLVPISDCIHMARFADESQAKDIQYLIQAVQLDVKTTRYKSDSSETKTDATLSDMTEIVDDVLYRISEQSLAQTIGLAIDHARASFLLESALVDSTDEFFQIITAFYLHLLRHTCVQVEYSDIESASPEAYALLERTYANQGGINAALLEAREGTQGGLRKVLDDITEHFKKKEQEKFINRVLGEILDPLDWNRKVEFTTIFLQRIQHLLPDEIKTASPKQYAHHYVQLVRLYVQSKDRFANYIHSL